MENRYLICLWDTIKELEEDVTEKLNNWYKCQWWIYKWKNLWEEVFLQAVIRK